MESEKNYYAILGVRRDASQDDIKRAYRRLILQTHPDRLPDLPDSEGRFQEISQAYNVLGDATRKARYDRESLLPSALDLSHPSTIKTARDLLSNVFGDVFGERREARRRGRDIRYTLTVNLGEALLGSSHEIEFETFGDCATCRGSGVAPGGRAPRECDLCEGRGELKGGGILSRRTPCGRCEGTGMVHLSPCTGCRGRATVRVQQRFTVRLPAGTEPGTERSIPGQGEPGRFGGAAGDLRITVNVRPHPSLTRRGREIHYALPVSISEAALGAKVPVPTLDGRVWMSVPAACASGTQFRLRGKGGGRPGGGRDDQIVTMTIETPRLADAGLKSALERLERLSGAPEVLPRRHAQRGMLAEAADAPRE
ncbi:MAG: J domain-containing protein [Nannocystaceae bacterium]